MKDSHSEALNNKSLQARMQQLCHAAAAAAAAETCRDYWDLCSRQDQADMACKATNGCGTALHCALHEQVLCMFQVCYMAEML